MAPTQDGGDDPTLYALGAMLGKNLQELHLGPAEIDQVKGGFADAALGRALKVDMATAGPKAQTMGANRRSASIKALAQSQKQKDAPFLQAAAAKPGARILSGGAIAQTLEPGSGASPGPNDHVRITFQGALADGTPFDSTEKGGAGGQVINVNGAIPCWVAGLESMKVGETVRLTCPPQTAYGDPGRPPGVPPGATVAFTLHLAEINPAPPPPRPPSHGPQPKPDDDDLERASKR